MVEMDMDREFRVREKGKILMELELVLVEEWKRSIRVYIERKGNGGK